MTDKNKLTENNFLRPIVKLKAISALFGNDDIRFVDDESFGVSWLLDDIVEEFQSIYDRWLEN